MTKTRKPRGRPKRPLRWWILVAIGGVAWCVVGGLFLYFLASPPITAPTSAVASPPPPAARPAHPAAPVASSPPRLSPPVPSPLTPSLSPEGRGSAAPVSTPPAPSGAIAPLLVDDFEVGQTSGLFAERKNRLDAFQGTWARRPSSTVITKVPDTRPGHPGQVLRLEYHKVGGWCGWYTLLNGVNAAPYNALTFWVRGEQGGERFDIGLADERMQKLEIDAVYVGTVKAFLPQGVTTDWQLVRVPLASLRSELDLTRMGSLVLWFRYEGAGAIQIDDVQFVSDPDVTRQQEYNRPRAAADPAVPRAMWLWKLDPVANAQVREDLFAFCEQTAVTHIFLYLGETPVTQASTAYQAQLAEFLEAAHRRGLIIDALTGNPLWTLQTNHQLVLDWIQGFLAYNAARPPAQRMDGVHLDVEPYLLAQWESEKASLKQQYVELLQQCRALIERARLPAFELGVAIPLFYDREQDFERQVLAQVDYAGLMDYYDASVDLIEKAAPHIALAGQLDKRIILGVETQDLVQMAQGKRRNTFHEEGWEEMEHELGLVTKEFRKRPGFGGLAIHCYESYRLLQRGRNVPTRDRPANPYIIPSMRRTQELELDGDLSEWQTMPSMVVDKKSSVVYGAGAWKGPQDLSVKIWSQWDDDAVYFAFDVTDDVVVQERRKGDMWEGDHIELWVDADLYGDYNEAMNSADDFQIGLSPGNFKDIPPEAFVWVPSVPASAMQEIAVGARKSAHGYTLEVRLPMRVLFSTLQRRTGIEPGAGGAPRPMIVPEPGVQNEVLADHRLRPGFRMGAMVDTSDADDPHQPQKCMMSTSKDRTWGDPTTFGILELQS